jgi:hypothetical protein
MSAPVPTNVLAKVCIIRINLLCRLWTSQFLRPPSTDASTVLCNFNTTSSVTAQNSTDSHSWCVLILSTKHNYISLSCSQPYAGSQVRDFLESLNLLRVCSESLVIKGNSLFSEAYCMRESRDTLDYREDLSLFRVLPLPTPNL